MEHNHIPGEQPRSKNHVEQFVVYKPDDLIVSSEGPLNLETICNNHQLRTDARIDLDQRFPDLAREVIRGIIDNPGKQLEWREQKEKLFAVLNYGDRTCNELRVRLGNVGGFGQFYLDALESPEYADHGSSHSRMFEATQKMLFLVNPTESLPDVRLVIASSFNPWFHDVMQLLRRKYNSSIEELRQDPRILHEEEAAFFIKCLTGFIAESGQMTFEDANQVTTYMAMFALVHDKPNEINAILSGTKKAFQTDTAGTIIPVPDAEVVDLYARHELDLTSLSPRQWFILFQGIRKYKQQVVPNKIPENPNSRYGLIPFIEEAFSHEIQNAISDDRPAFTIITEEQRRQVQSSLLLNVLPDLIDMGYPADYAILRKNCGSKALLRPIAQPSTDLVDAMDIEHEGVKQSDWSRSMVEYYLIVEFLKKTNLWKNEKFREIVGNTILMHAVLTDKMYEGLMEEYGNRMHTPVISQTLHESTDRRIQSVALKALRKHGGISERVYDAVRESFQEKPTDAVLKTVYALLGSNIPANVRGDTYGGRLERAIETLHAIVMVGSKNVSTKPSPKTGTESSRSPGIIYSKGDIVQRENNFNTYFVMLCKLIGITDAAEQQILLNSFREGRYQGIPCFVPQGTTSLGDIADARTIHKREIIL